MRRPLLEPVATDFNPTTRTGRSTPNNKVVSPEPPQSRAQTLFQGQKHPKNKKKIVRMEQWIEVRIVEGKAVTRLYPSNQDLIARGQRMLPPPEFVYRRINFPDGIPPEYDWVGVIDEDHRQRGGCGIQRMTVNTWLEVIDREAQHAAGHLNPVPNLPRANDACDCPTCRHNSAAFAALEKEAQSAGRPFDLDSLLASLLTSESGS